MHAKLCSLIVVSLLWACGSKPPPPPAPPAVPPVTKPEPKPDPSDSRVIDPSDNPSAGLKQDEQASEKKE